MWIVLGPFDGDVDKKVDFTKQKLLKPGNEYVVARKNTALTIRHSKISRQHIVFEVGECSEEDVANPNFIPKLTVQNPNEPHRKVTHEDGTESRLNGHGSLPLKHGDSIQLLHDVVVSVKWDKIACCCPPNIDTFDSRDCAKLGIPITHKPHPDVTHHLTPTYSLTPTIATSLLSAAHLVKPSWLTDLIDYYSPLESDDASTKEYHLPAISKHRPTHSPALPSSLKNHRSWEPNEARVGMFKGHRVIFVGERGREASEEYKELVKRGEGTYECCAVQGGRKPLHDVLAKAVGKDAKIVLIADQAAMVAAVGQDSWNEMTEEAASYQLRFIPAEKLVVAVAQVDLAYVDCTTVQSGASSGAGTSLPDAILNTHPEEPSIAPPLPSQRANPAPALEPASDPAPRKKLTRRVISRQPSAEPSSAATPGASAPSEAGPSRQSSEPVQEEPFKLRRPLVRRAVTKKPMIVGIDDPSFLEGDSTTVSEVPPPKPVEETAPPFSRRFNLKRRIGTTQQQQQPPASQLFSAVEKPAEEEPPHKKFKALFEQSDPDKIAQELASQEAATAGESLTQPESVFSTQAQGRAARELAAVPEEEEETGTSVAPGTQARSQGVKRKAAEVDEDVEMADEENRPAKRRAEGDGTARSQAATQQVAAPATGSSGRAPSSKVFTNASNKSGTQKSAATGDVGAAPGKPDQDEAFLKAVASTKRGKKHEDQFDREFNNLRISKPDLQREEAEKQWAVLDEFGDDGDVRGNFMVVVEMDLFRKEDPNRGVARAGGRMDWEGRPDFKKFKKKAAGERPKPVEVFVSDDDGLGISDSWKFKSSQSQSQKVKESNPSQKAKPPSQSRKEVARIKDSDSEVEEEIAPKRMSTQSKTRTQGVTQAKRAPSVQPTRSTRGTQARSQKKSQPLFVESDEEPELDADNGMGAEHEDTSQPLAGVEEDDESPPATLRSNARSQASRPSRAAKKKNAPIMLDDSDDDMTFQGFDSGKSSRR